MFCSISYTKDSLWALTNDVWSASSTLHDRRYLAASVPATRDAQQISLISSFCVQAMSFGGQICVTIHLYLFSIWARQHCFVKRHFFLKFCRPPQDISVRRGKEYSLSLFSKSVPIQTTFYTVVVPYRRTLCMLHPPNSSASQKTHYS